MVIVTDLKRLLQYLHGSAFGFCCRVSPFSSAWLDGGDASIDWSGNIAPETSVFCANWGIETETLQCSGGESTLRPPREWGKGGREEQEGRAGGQILPKQGTAGCCRGETKWPNQGRQGHARLDTE